VDNIFPHHEDEIAQGLGAFRRVPAEHWAHGAHLTVDGRRMAKSTGNVVRVADLVEHGIEPLSFRYLCLTARYRARLNFTWTAAEAAAHALDRLRRSVTPGPQAAALGEDAVKLDDSFRAALLADLDTPSALVSLERMVASRIPVAEKRALLGQWDRVLGLDLAPAAHQDPQELDPEEEAWLSARSRARDRRDYAEADRLRGLLAAHGVEVADNPDGTRWRRAQVTDPSHAE
jgi:cysteinyl-tRNA synthetase